MVASQPHDASPERFTRPYRVSLHRGVLILNTREHVKRFLRVASIIFVGSLPQPPCTPATFEEQPPLLTLGSLRLILPPIPGRHSSVLSMLRSRPSSACLDRQRS